MKNKHKIFTHLNVVFFWLIILIQINVSFGQDEYGEENEDVEFKLANTKITVPWNDFRQLIERFKPDTIHEEHEEELPAQYVLSDAVFTGKPINDQECKFDATITVTVLDSKAWIEVPLGRGLSVYPEITVNKRTGSMGMKDDGSCYIFLHGKGNYEISYSFLVPVTYVSGKSTAAFPLPDLSASRIKFDLQNSAYTVTANERPLVFNTIGRKGVYEGGLGICSDAVITWQQTTNVNGNKDAMISANFYTTFSIASEVVKINSQINLSVVHNSIRQFRFSVPHTVDIIDITGNSVTTWESKDSADLRIITVYLKYDVIDNVNYTLHAEMNFEDTATMVVLPQITLLNISRQEGLIGVGVLNSIEINPMEHSSNVLLRDKRELPQWFSDHGDIIHVYQYLSDNYKIALKIIRHNYVPVLNALISRADLQSMIRDDGKMVTTLSLLVKNRGEQFLRLDWNMDNQLWSVYCNGKPSRPSIDTATHTLLIPIPQKSDRTMETKVKVTYLSLQKPITSPGIQEVIYTKFNMPVQNFRGTLFLPHKVRPLFIKGSVVEHKKRADTPWFSSSFNAPKCPVDVRAINGEKICPETIMNEEIRGSQTRSHISFQKSGGGLKQNIDQLWAEIDQQRDFEAGVLSIPVQVQFEGLQVSLFSPMLIKGEIPFISFWYFQLDPSFITWINCMVFILLLLVSLILTILIKSRFTVKLFVYGVLAPFTLAFLLKRCINESLNIDSLFIIPALFLGYLVIQHIWHFIRKRINKSDNKVIEQLPDVGVKPDEYKNKDCSADASTMGLLSD